LKISATFAFNQSLTYDFGKFKLSDGVILIANSFRIYGWMLSDPLAFESVFAICFAFLVVLNRIYVTSRPLS